MSLMASIVMSYFEALSSKVKFLTKPSLLKSFSLGFTGSYLFAPGCCIFFMASFSKVLPYLETILVLSRAFYFSYKESIPFCQIKVSLGL